MLDLDPDRYLFSPNGVLHLRAYSEHAADAFSTTTAACGWRSPVRDARPLTVPLHAPLCRTCQRTKP